MMRLADRRARLLARPTMKVTATVDRLRRAASRSSTSAPASRISRHAGAHGAAAHAAIDAELHEIHAGNAALRN